MRDEVLELWLRLLALHLPEPTDDSEYRATLKIRNQWFLASKGYFNGCIPHGMEDACATQEGRTAVRVAISSLLEALQQVETPLDPHTLNLLGYEGGSFTTSIERATLLDIGFAFLDLLDGKITDDASLTRIFPGIKPYQRNRNND